MRRLLGLIIVLLGLLFVIDVAQKHLPTNFNFGSSNQATDNKPVKVVTEESITIDIAKKAGPSVVTIAGISTAPQNSQSPYDFFFGAPIGPSTAPEQPQSIGTGFMVDASGIIVTNKHVIADASLKYQVITSNEKKYTVQNIYRDPLNDLALLKIDLNQNPGDNLKQLTLGDSTNLQVGQYAIAIGTALGEFRNTVTTGVISGLGRGITAGSPYEGSVERLDNVIQTSAAINPGNSGGPLINSSGQVIGINTAVSSSGQNIGFAIPINVIKETLKNFNNTGQFDRAYLGVSYQMITGQIATQQNLPEGAYVQNVIQGSSADDAGIQSGDVITKIDDMQINESHLLSTIISQKKIGDTIKITLHRDGKDLDVEATLKVAPEQ